MLSFYLFTLPVTFRDEPNKHLNWCNSRFCEFSWIQCDDIPFSGEFNSLLIKEQNAICTECLELVDRQNPEVYTIDPCINNGTSLQCIT